MQKKITVSILGASGYAGGELLRILLGHPNVKIVSVSSRRFEGRYVHNVHPNLRGLTNLIFCQPEDIGKCDLLFIALPNGESMKYMNSLKKMAKKIIDLSADFRLRDRKLFEEWYDIEHEAPNFLGQFVYGLAELHRDKIRKSMFLACGGCEATAVILGLYPLVKTGLLEEDGIIADIKIGSSAGGFTASSSAHHPERANVIRSYKPTHHRHEAEVEQELGVKIEISATAVDLVRGILATIHTRVKKGISEKDIWRSFRTVYKKEPFIRIVKQKQGLYRYPEPKILWGTNYCDIGFEMDTRTNRLVVIAAIDNLVKGTAGQAVQVMNIMFGFPETTGLEFPGLHPI